MNLTKKLLALFLALCVLLSICPAVLAAENESGAIIVDHDATADLDLRGDASKTENGEIELTPLEFWQSGAVWYRRQIDTTGGFETSFDFWAGGGRNDSYGGADGIVLTLSDRIGLGSDGEYLGFVDGSVGVELDSYCENDGDPEGKHIAIISDDVSNHLDYVMDDRVDDSSWHTLKITYDSGRLTVYLGDEKLLEKEEISLPNEVYLGISAATGAGYNRHMIRNFLIKGVVSSGEAFAKDIHPIIIVPGIMGSRLYTGDGSFSDETRVWDPVIGEDKVSWTTISSLLTLNSNVSDDMYVRPCENQQDYEDGGSAFAYDREYGAQDIYENLIDTLCEQFPGRGVYMFSYDWRKSNRESAQLLAEEIDRIAAEYDGKVDLVCHSMGGLVASSYYDQYGAEKLDKIITCGTPYEGAPKLLNSVLTNQLLDDLVNNIALNTLGGLTRNVKAGFDGVAELTPTYRYVTSIPMWKDHWAPFDRNDYELSYSEYADICSEIFGSDRYSDAVNFQNSLKVGDLEESYPSLYEYENAYFMIGVNQPTITSIKFQLTTNGVDSVLYENDLSYSMDGDKTVPYYSASMGEMLEETNDHVKQIKADHTNLVRKEKPLEWVCGILDKGVSLVEDTPLNERGYIVIRVACPVDVTVSMDGEQLCYDSDADYISNETEFGRMDLLGENGEIKMFCLEVSDAYGITLEGTDSGTMDYAIRFFDENDELLEERSFEDVPLTAETVITTGTNPAEETVLEIDADGDGAVDEELVYGQEKEEEIQISFADVDPSAYYYEAVRWAVKKDITKGTSETTFSPDQGCTRAQVVTFLWAANGKPEPTSMENPFADVADDAWYAKPVLWAVENGITSGITENAFGPDMTCTRAQIVTFLYAAVSKPYVDTSESPFADVDVSAWYVAPVLWAKENGVTGGISATEFGPDNTCTRAQVVMFLYKVYGG